MSVFEQLRSEELVSENQLIIKEEMILKEGEMLKDEEDYYRSIVLFYLMMMIEYEMQKKWEDFANEIKSKSRFFPESGFLIEIKQIEEYATSIIKNGEILYRAREYSQSHLMESKWFKIMVQEIKKAFPDLNHIDMTNENHMQIVAMRLCGDNEKYVQIVECIKSLLEEQAPFYGFDKKNSDAPPSSLAREGRANAKGISYLYTAKDIKTAILEMRPQIKKSYNICSVKLIRDAKIFDFTYVPQEMKENDYSKMLDLHRISEEFSKPNFGDSIEYVPTQFLCEYIRKIGFDGIKFKSAVDVDGYNIVLFDTKEETRLYDIVESKIYTVNSINVDIGQMIPF